MWRRLNELVNQRLEQDCVVMFEKNKQWIQSRRKVWRVVKEKEYKESRRRQRRKDGENRKGQKNKSLGEHLIYISSILDSLNTRHWCLTALSSHTCYLRRKAMQLN